MRSAISESKDQLNGNHGKVPIVLTSYFCSSSKVNTTVTETTQITESHAWLLSILLLVAILLKFPLAVVCKLWEQIPVLATNQTYIYSVRIIIEETWRGERTYPVGTLDGSLANDWCNGNGMRGCIHLYKNARRYVSKFKQENKKQYYCLTMAIPSESKWCNYFSF